MMKKIISCCLTILFAVSAYTQSAVGIWKTIDDVDGTAKSHVEIYESNGKLEGKIVKLINASSDICESCKGDKAGKPLTNMVILWDMEKQKGAKWDNGTIMDPHTGKEYKCKIEIIREDELEVRGYIGISMFGRSQTWFRVD